MTAKRKVRLVFFSFVITFLVMRMTVLLIMTRRVPDLYIHLHGTHLHHLNFGIFILAAVGAYTLFCHPAGRAATAAAVSYGIGLALTFDEFGMWVFLQENYWGRASFDAGVIIAGLLGVIVAAPVVHNFMPRHWIAVAILTLAVIAFALALVDSFRYTQSVILPEMQRVESAAPK